MCVAALNPAVKAVLRRAPVGVALGPERMFYGLEGAVERFRSVGLEGDRGAASQNASPAPK